ncbi:MAG: M24 family metallopeptidase [Clostridia bacterium]|nr:M24 family metallopeptidase [Clostridia bacterium]
MTIKTHLLQEEVSEKEARVEKLCLDLGLDGLCFFKFTNFAWFTGGGTNRVVTGSERGCSFILYLRGSIYVFAPINEIDRITAEQIPFEHYEAVTYDWFANPINVLKDKIKDLKVGSDVPIPGLELVSDEIDRLRFSLTQSEVAKAQEIALICSERITSACVDARPGISEQEITARISGELLEQGVKPAVLLVGTDDRVFTCRHPVPTGKKLEKYGLISLVGEKWGIHITLTRAFYLGKLPEDIRKKQLMVCQVDGAMIANTIPGEESDLAFKACQNEFARLGYPDEWKCHHQGGAIGYAPREFRAGERSEKVQVNQMFGWNPTLKGTKSESTILVKADGSALILDVVPAWWPTAIVDLGDKQIVRPLILEN